MAKKRRKMGMPEAETPIAAMIDVVFLLLMYFIVTQEEVIEDTFLQVNLPGGVPPIDFTKEPPPPPLKIDVMKLRENSDEYYHINGVPFHINDLREYLRTVAENNEKTTVIINCGPNARHRKLITLLDMCNEFGLTKINLINDFTVAFVPEKT